MLKKIKEKKVKELKDKITKKEHTGHGVVLDTDKVSEILFELTRQVKYLTSKIPKGEGS